MRPGPIWPAVKSLSPAAKVVALAEPAHPLDLERLEIGEHLIASPFDDGLWRRRHDEPDCYLVLRNRPHPI